MERPSQLTSQLGLGIALAIGLVASTSIFMYLKMNAWHTITVKGYAEKPVQSEQGVWSGTIKVRHEKIQEGYKELGEQMAAVKHFVEEMGFESSSIDLGAPRHDAVYQKTKDGRNFTNEVEYYNLSQTISVKSSAVKSIHQLANQISKVNENGYDLTSEGAKYYYPSDKLELIKLQMIAEATQNAKLRADQFALNSGSRVGRLVDARQGVFQVVAPYSSSGDYDRYDTSSIDKVVKLVVTLTYNVS